MTSRQKATSYLSLAAAAAILIVMMLLRPNPTPVLREVPAAELTRRDALCFWKNEVIPFTGAITETYPDGSRKSRSFLSNGVMHGISEGWYPNGNLQVREYFHEGVSHGLREKWFQTGAKMSETTIRTGKIEGVFKRWHENGALAEEVQMKAGAPEGTSLAYNPDGTLKARVTLQDGKVTKQEFWNTEPGRTHASKATIPGSVPAL